MKGKPATVEESFPRDAIEEKSESKEIKKSRKRPAEDVEFGDELVKRQAKRPKKGGDKSKNDIRLKPLAFHLEKDLSVLGCVDEIRDYEVSVTLPDGLKGRLAITNIGTAYTEKLRRLAASDPSAPTEGDDRLLSLHEIFHPGTLVRCRVLETNSGDGGKKPLISLTVDPKLVNQDLAELSDGMTVSGVVCAVEDHGFDVDVGLASKKAFLPRQEAERFASANASFPENVDLSVGSYITCLVAPKKHERKPVSRVVTVALDPARVGAAVRNDATLQSLLPGTVVECTIDAKVETAILVRFGKENSGVIFNSSLERAQDKYEVGEELTATVLYVQPGTKVAVLSQLGHLRNPALYDDPFVSAGTGAGREGRIIKVVPKVGLYVRLEDGLKGLVKKNHVGDKSIDLKDFKKGETLRCRVIGHDRLSRLVLLTMKESLLNMTHFSYSDVRLGEVLSCTVKKLGGAGAVVRVTSRISGLVPRMHLSDIPLANPERKFREGREIKCRVLSVDAEESKMVLTHKKSLVRPRHLMPYAYEEVEVKSLLTGFVVVVRSTGLLVAFGGEVKGWVPKKELSHEVVDEPVEKRFYLGQVVDCRVKFVSAEEKKIVLSLKISPNGGTRGEEGKRKRKEEETEDGDGGEEPKVEGVDAAKVKAVEVKNEKKVEGEKKNEEEEGEAKKKKKNSAAPPKVLQLPGGFDWEQQMEVDSPDTKADVKADKEITRKVKADKLKNKTNDEEKLELEKATLLEPNSSANWIKLIGFTTEKEGVEVARQISDRAVASISYREEQERLNVRLCRLNLEHAYGTPDSFRSYYESCLSACDQLKVMSHVRDLRSTAGETDAAVDVCKVMTRKFKGDPEVWVGYGAVLYAGGRVERARALLKEATERLPESSRVQVVTKFALLESEFGVPDVSDTMFENVLKNFPKRTDVWSIYVDRCVKQSRHDQARNVLRRACSLEPPLPAKKAAFLLRKYVAFEEAHGSPLVVDELKTRLEKIEGVGEE